jgi:hypothetical protein
MERTIDSIRFGLEIEVEFPQGKNSQDLIDKHRLIPGWDIDCDFSLDNGAEYRPTNRNKLYFNDDTFDQIDEIIGLIKAHKGNIRPSCGIHIHVDMKDFSAEEIVNIVRKFYKIQDKLYKNCKVVKKRLDEYAMKIPERALDDLHPKTIKILRGGRHNFGLAKEPHSYFTDKYYGLNVSSLITHKTLEFRLFNGSIQSRRIKKYIKWCLEFCIKNGVE